MAQNNFLKITEEFYYDVNRKDDIKEYLEEWIHTHMIATMADKQMELEESLIDCESPVEQLLSMSLENLGLKNINKFNPFVDVVTIAKQEEIICKDKTYRVDFFIPVLYKNQNAKGFIIECDGHEFHQKTKEQVEKDNIRTRNLQKRGFEVIRFSGTEIWHRPYKCAEEVLNIILSKCNYEEN